MEKADLTSEQYDSLIERIFKILAELGPSHTTMDLLARRLSMSKRTLYEIFGSKDDMIKQILEHLQKKHQTHIEAVSSQCDNVMEMMVHVLLYQQQIMSCLSAKFFKDMDDRYSHLRGDYESNSRKWTDHISSAINLGISQGVFRPEANYHVILPLMRVQMESLKRMEEYFPPEITLAEAYSAIAQGFLRSIATPKGLLILEQLTSKVTPDNEIN